MTDDQILFLIMLASWLSGVFICLLFVIGQWWTRRRSDD